MTALAKGDYCLATKYSDGDPGDGWAVGFFLGMCGERYRVGDAEGNDYRRGGFKRIRNGLRDDVGKWLVENNRILEISPPGTVNLWTMLTETAFQFPVDKTTGATDE